MNFLKSKPKNKRFNTYWEIILDMWNMNNSIMTVDPEQSIPDYTKL